MINVFYNLFVLQKYFVVKGNVKFRHIILLVYTTFLGLSYIFPNRLWAFSTILVFPIFIQIGIWMLFIALVFPGILSIIDHGIDRAGYFIFIKYKKFAPYIIGLSSLALLLIAWNDHILFGDSDAAYSFVKDFPSKTIFGHNRVFSVVIYKIFCSIISFCATCWRSITILHIIFGIILDYNI